MNHTKDNTYSNYIITQMWHTKDNDGLSCKTYPNVWLKLHEDDR